MTDALPTSQALKSVSLGNSESKGFDAQRGLSVTPPTLRPLSRENKKVSCPIGPTEWTFLACGIDTLDVTVGIQWSQMFKRIQYELEDKRQGLQGSGVDAEYWRTIENHDYLLCPSGKKNYRYRLKTPYGEICIGVASADLSPSNNGEMHFSPASIALWNLGREECFSRLERFITNLGGTLLYIKPSRVDLCADFHIPEGLDLDFLEICRVSRTTNTHPHLDDRSLQTWYLYSKDSSVLLRIYNKSLEIEKSNKPWFWDVWGIEKSENVWRVEYEVKRKTLKGYAINEVTQLEKMVSALWAELTGNWMSLRLPDHKRNTRRTVHPWWLDVQEVSLRFGEYNELGKAETLEPMSLDHFIKCIAGYYVGYGARQGNCSMSRVMNEVNDKIRDLLTPEEYTRQVKDKMIKLGRSLLPPKGAYPESWESGKL